MIVVCPDKNARLRMTRDVELIRRILLAIDKRKDADYEELQICGIDHIVLYRHLELLSDAGLIDALVSQELVARVPCTITIKDMTWEGHELLAAIKQHGVWDKIKKSFSASELAGLPLSVLKDVGIALLKDWAKKHVGI